MHALKAIVTGTLLATCLGAQAQSTATTAARPTHRPKTSKPRPKTQENILLEQLNDRFRKLDDLNQKYDDLQRKFDALQKSETTRDAELDQAKKDAADAEQKLTSMEQAIGPAGNTVTTLQTAVATLTSTSTALSTQVQTTQQQTKQLLNPETIHFKGIDLKPGGFLAAETVNRQRAVGGDINTPFAAIPFAGQTAGLLSEFNASGRQSRISLLADGKLPSATLRGYYEADFLSAGTTSNSNQSNSYTLRQRQVWAQAALNDGWTLTGGQMWSLATEYGHGLANLSEAIRSRSMRNTTPALPGSVSTVLG